MTSLFIRFYLGVLAVLVVAWFIHGHVSETQHLKERSRVIEAAHGGGARLAARELDAAPADHQEVLNRLQSRFSFPVRVVSREDTPATVSRRLDRGDDVIYHEKPSEGGFVFAALADKQRAVRFGVMPGPGVTYIEQGLGGGLITAAARLDAVPDEKRPEVLARLQSEFDYPIEIVKVSELPKRPQMRIGRGEKVVFFEIDGKRSFIVTPLANGDQLARFGPFPNFERVDQKAIATTLAFVLLLAALAIALLLRPVARQLRHLEHAARSIADGDLSARVDEKKMNSAKALTRAFNHMAERTEGIVRTQRELLQAVSHELRTPLARMRFAIELIQDAEEEGERHERLKSLEEATEELNDLVGELLTYVRLETAEPELSLEPVELVDFFDELLPKYRILYPHIQFQVAPAEQQDLFLTADRRDLQRVVGNLLSNAGRHAARRVTIRTSADERLVILDVDDDGRGIPLDKRQIVLEPFTRLEENGKGPGAGLGLALVRRILERHSGSVEVQTSPLGGCRIRTCWPKKENQPAIVREPSAVPASI